MPVPLYADGRTAPEAWEKSLIACHAHGAKVKTQYDRDPNTGVTFPPSVDCTMRICIDQVLSEPRLHVCTIGGPNEMGDYAAEVVFGIRDHWVKRRPEDREWAYTYSGRLHRYGDMLNSAAPDALFGIGDDDPENPWVGLAFVRDVIVDGDRAKVYLDVRPLDQITRMIELLVDEPYTRRAVAETSFPPVDMMIDDPPCLRYIWCRGFQDGEKGHLRIHMNTHWRSRDAWKAAPFNIFGMAEILSVIVARVQSGVEERIGELSKAPCPVCGSGQGFITVGEKPYEKICTDCGSLPFVVEPGPYIDTSDSYHIYGKDIEAFEATLLRAVETRSPEDRWWDMKEKMMDGMVEEGMAEAVRMVRSRDERDGRTNMHRTDDGSYENPIEIRLEGKEES